MPFKTSLLLIFRVDPAFVRFVILPAFPPAPTLKGMFDVILNAELRCRIDQQPHYN